MKAARVIVLGVALAAGGIAAYLAHGGRQRAPQRLATVEVLVAKADLGIGHAIGAQDIGWQKWPLTAAGPSFITRAERPSAVKEFVGAIVREPIAPGETIRNPMVSFLAPGTRAVAIDLSSAGGNGNVVVPDERVDILLTRRDRAGKRASGTMRFAREEVLENVRMLAAAAGKSATVELTPEQAKTLARAQKIGALSVVAHSNERHGPINVVRYGVSAPTTSR